MKAIHEQFTADLQANLAEYHASEIRGTQAGRVRYLEAQMRVCVQTIDAILRHGEVDKEVDKARVDAAVHEAIEERE